MTVCLNRRSAAWIILVGLLAPGCGGGGLELDDRGGGHGSFEGVELSLADTGTLLAEWSIDQGWRDPSGDSLDSLPPAVRSGSSDELVTLRVGGPAAFLRVSFVSQEALDIAPLSGRDANSERQCGEFSARYFPLDDSTPVIAWPNIPHPEQSEGSSLFAKRADGELVQIFHCNRLDIYPEQAGIAQLEIVLWHVNHGDQAADALAVEVLEGS